MLFTRKIEVATEKPWVMLLHGLYSSSSNWYPIARMLECNVLLVDLPNHGRSTWVDDFSYRGLARAVNELIDREMVVVGHSLGGRVATMLAADNPLVTGLMVIDISPISTRKSERTFLMAHRFFLELMVEARENKVTDIEAFLVSRGATEDMCAAVEQAYRQMNVAVVAEQIMGMVDEWCDIMSHFQTITTPTIFVRGTASPYIADAALPELAKVFINSSVKEIEGGTHRLHHQFPELLSELIKNFANENSGCHLP